MRIGFGVARSCFAISTLIISVTTAVAQSSKLPNPADPGAAAPPVRYESAFSDYQPFQEQESNSWKQVNKEVADNPGMGSMKDMPGMPGMDSKTLDAPMSKEGAGARDMDSMKDMPGETMPGMESKISDAPMSKEEVGGHDMNSMKDMPDKATPGMDSKITDAQRSKEGAGGHDMDSMKDMPGKPMLGTDSKPTKAQRSKEGAGGHDMHSMKGMPGKTKPGKDSKNTDAPINKKGHGEMAMAKPQTATGQSTKAQTAGITGTGVVQGIDKANGKVKLTHDPIAALGWPKMTMFFRLKDSSLADQVKKGDKVEFSLEKSASGYVISGFQKGGAGHDMKQMKK